MTPAELSARRDEVQIVDVRWPNEWEAGRIEGSIHIPWDELEDRAREIGRNRPVATVCRTGTRSAGAAEELGAEGYDAESLEGGLLAWVEEGHAFTGEVVEPEEPPDGRPEAHQRLQSEFLSVLFAVQEHFGDADPSDEEVLAFLRQRLVNEGRSPDEADEFLANL